MIPRFPFQNYKVLVRRRTNDEWGAADVLGWWEHIAGVDWRQSTQHPAAQAYQHTNPPTGVDGHLAVLVRVYSADAHTSFSDQIVHVSDIIIPERQQTLECLARLKDEWHVEYWSEYYGFTSAGPQFDRINFPLFSIHPFASYTPRASSSGVAETPPPPDASIVLGDEAGKDLYYYSLDTAFLVWQRQRQVFDRRAAVRTGNMADGVDSGTDTVNSDSEST